MTLSRPAPGALYPWARRFAWLETAIFTGLLVVWIAPGMAGATTFFGWAHGFGYLALLGVLFAAVLRHEIPFWLLLLTFNPLGPIGTVAGFALLERRRLAAWPSRGRLAANRPKEEGRG